MSGPARRPRPADPSTPLASPTPTAAAAPATIPQRAIAEEVAVGVRRAEPVSDTPPSARRGERQPQPPSPRSACSRSARSRPSSWRIRTAATAARLIAGRSRPDSRGHRRSRFDDYAAQRDGHAVDDPAHNDATRHHGEPHHVPASGRTRTDHHGACEHHHAGPERARHRLAAATGRRGLLVRAVPAGEAGIRRILEAWPVEPRFTLPRKAPDGSALEPGRYSWSAAPQESRRGRIRYTGLTRAGRFVLTADGQTIPRR